MTTTNAWIQLSTFQVLLLGMMLMMTVFSFIQYLAFRIPSAGMRLLFNLSAIAGVLSVGIYQAEVWNSFVYYIATNIVTLFGAILYIRLLCLGLDMRLYNPTVSSLVYRLKRVFPWLGLSALLLDLTLNTYSMSILIVIFCSGMLWSMGQLWFRNRRPPAYIFLFMVGATILLSAAIVTFGMKFFEVNLGIDNQEIVYNLLLPALSLEFITFTSGDMLRQRHAISMRDRLLAEIKQVRGAQRDQESLSLAYRLNTHTLANVLNRIQHSLVKHDATIAMNLVHDYSAFLRSLLQLEESGSHTLQEEADLLRRYLDLNKTQLGTAFSYRLVVDADPTLQVPCMICLPGVENSIIHGFGDGLCRKPEINIYFKQEGKLLSARICDNGRGLPENISSENRFGLKNTRKRLALLSEKTGIESSYELIDRSKAGEPTTGACLILGIPIMNL